MNLNIVDMHCDTISKLRKRRSSGLPGDLWENAGHVDLKRLRQAGYLLQNFALFVNKGTCADPWKDMLELAELYEAELTQNQDHAGKVLNYDDIARNAKMGKISCMLTVEEGGVCQGDTNKIQILYDMGVRMLTLTWNYPNELGAPNLHSEEGKKISALHQEWQEIQDKEIRENKKKAAQEALLRYLDTPERERGLTETGKEFVSKMEELGMIGDVSHLSDKGFYDVLQIAKKPFVASHSNARAICPCVRNLTDDMIRHLANRGGVMGLNFCRDFLVPRDPYPYAVSLTKDTVSRDLNTDTVRVNRNDDGDFKEGIWKSVDALITHAKHICHVGGIEVLGLGSDFDGIDDPGELTGAEQMYLLWDGLLKAGFHQSEVDKIFSKNVLRLYKTIL
jgi:membrane dipeptidase